ncbi:hypothetical protein DL96DRAFT_1012511 [Flagelloscypha sp. PMI_526]|nr:hypothetical protein DL96DRAFT_1012511 [Flagelloscypha sp. PMI_526]
MASSSSTEDTRAAKRRRTPESDSESLLITATYSRGQPWFDDGNLILQSNDGIRFKVYRGLLALHSTVFSDMFTLPQPLNQELVESCPFVVLPVSGVELTIFLQLISTQSGSFFESDSSVSFDQLSVMLRLGKKYNVQRLRHNAVRILCEAYPGTLGAFDKSSKHLLSTATALELAWLAFSENVDIVLPILCYISIDLTDLPCLLRDECKKNNGEPLVTSPEFKTFLAAGLVSAFVGQSGLTFSWLDSTAGTWVPECATERKCRKAIDKLAHEHFGPKDHAAEIGLTCLFSQKWWPPSNLCENCVDEMEDRQEDDRAKFWDALPSFFGLPPWEELRKKHSLLSS